MIKTIGFLLLWLAGSASAVAIAWTGVSIVDDELIAPAPANNQIAVGDPRTIDTIPTIPTTIPSLASSSSPGPTPAVEPIAPSTPDSDEATPPETPAVPSTTAASQPTTSPAPTATANPPSSPTTSTPTPTTVPPSPTTAPAQTRTFNLIGGRTAISFSSTRVKVLWATPNPGFTVEIEPKSDGTRVDFEADHHESRIDAWWAGGPQHEIREKAD